MNKSVIVHGPQACGKTRNAEALKRHFGLSRVVDDWIPGQEFPLVDTLVLTFHPPQADGSFWGTHARRPIKVERRVAAFADVKRVAEGIV